MADWSPPVSSNLVALINWFSRMALIKIYFFGIGVLAFIQSKNEFTLKKSICGKYLEPTNNSFW